MPMRRPTAIALALALIGTAALSWDGRKRFIQTFFERGKGGGAPPALPAAQGDDATTEADRLRVVLIDGLGAAHADRLPAITSFCDGGTRLTVDVGFPTVSLPVQSALWTGLTQQQTGIEFVPKALSSPLETLASRVDSIAVAESHPYIVHSLGFTDTEPPAEIAGSELTTWKNDGFRQAALRAVGGEARLAFVHILRVDVAGHRHGSASDEYGEASRTADALFGELVAAGPPDARWVVLSDHGHRPAGGHGGAEPSIRRVRACVAGPGVETANYRQRPIHLVDLSRYLADSLGVSLAEESVGRPLRLALASGMPDPTPSPSAGRLIVALLLFAVGLALSMWASGRRFWLGPFWLVVAYGSLLVIQGAPTLSTPMTYSPVGRDLALGLLPGVALCTVALGASVRRRALARPLVALLVPVIAIDIAIAVVILRRPPLLPLWTAHASTALILTTWTFLAAGLAVLAACVRPVSDPNRRSESSDTGP